MQIHDEIIVEIPEQNLEKCSQILHESMENVFKSRGFELNFPIKLSYGKNWGSLVSI